MKKSEQKISSFFSTGTVFLFGLNLTRKVSEIVVTLFHNDSASGNYFAEFYLVMKIAKLNANTIVNRL
jgi:hypothetical protein